MKQLLSRKGIDYIELDVDMSSSIKQDLYQRCAEEKHWQTIEDVKTPILFVNKVNIGGLDEVYALIADGSFASVIK